MDLDYSFNERVIIVPKNYKIKFKLENEIINHYSFIGIGTVINNYPLIAEGKNENNVYVSCLNFPIECFYFPKDKNKKNYAPYELPLLILSKCKTMKEVRKILKELNLVNIPFNNNIKLTPLHYLISYKNESIVIESTKEGLKVYDNQYNILTNSPNFTFHSLNLVNYIQLHNNFPYNNLNQNYNFNIYSYGLGAIGLPGDYSSTSRFIKGFFIKNYLELTNDYEYNIIQIFKCLDSISMIKNIIKTNINYEYTRYTSCYYDNYLFYKTYTSNINVININDYDLDSNELINIKMNESYYFNKEKEIIV